MLPCLNKKIFGFDCPGCGFQRSTVLISKGEFREAFEMFPGIYTTLLLLVGILFHFLLKKTITSKILIILGVINIIVITLTYILKIIKILN